MQFISDRSSLAESFAFQTKNESSYMLSSRASRRRVVYEESLDQAQQQIEDFKEQIEEKYRQSIANKIYTFPFNYACLDMFDDSQFEDLQGDIEVCLYDNDEQNHFDRNKFKISNKKIKNEKVSNILAQLKSLKENVMNLTLFNEDSICKSTETKPTNNVSLRKSKEKIRPQLKSGRTKITYETLQSQEQSPNVKRHLHTQPYEKPLGYILKKK